jgi:uncharacterized protein (TIGR03437 family)
MRKNLQLDVFRQPCRSESGRSLDTGLLSAGSLLPGAVAPGEIITIMGRNIGPSPGVLGLINGSEWVGDLVGGTRVLFDGEPAPVLFSKTDQVNAVVPFGIASRSVTQIQIKYRDVLTNGLAILVVPAIPALFTLDLGGKGQGAILNADGSVNSFLNPAELGSIITLYATGTGQTNPAGIDGKITAQDVSNTSLPVTVLIGGSTANVLYSGTAPGLVAGTTQINVRIPTDVLSGNAVPILCSVGNATSQTGVTVAVR